MYSEIACLERYISNSSKAKYVPEESNFVDWIQWFGVERLFYERISSLDRSTFIKLKSEFLVQESVNEVLWQEMNALNVIGRTKGVRLVHLKGLTLAHDTYPTPELRKSTDIDIFLRNDDLQSLVSALSGLGYLVRETGSPIAESITQLTVARRHHLPAFSKIGSVFGQDVAISLEVHLELLSMPIYFRMDSEEIIWRAEQREYPVTSCWVLESNDRLVHLMAHFARDFLAHWLEMIAGGQRSLVNLRLLHDIALFVSRFRPAIDWMVVAERARAWQCAPEVALAVHLLNHVYTGWIPNTVLTLLLDDFEPEFARFESLVFPEMLQIDPDAIIWGGVSTVMSIVDHKLRPKGPQIHCFYGTPALRRAFSIDEHSGEIRNAFGSHLCIGRLPTSSHDCSAHGTLWWDERYLHINVEVLDDVLIFEDELGGPYDEDGYCGDSLSFVFGINGGAEVKVKRFTLIPSENLDRARLLEDMTSRNVDDDSFECRLRRCEYGYEVHISFSWALIGVKPRKGARFGFDIEVSDCDKPNEGTKTKLVWASSSGIWAWRDPVLHGEVCLS